MTKYDGLHHDENGNRNNKELYQSQEKKEEKRKITNGSRNSK